ncbi:4487_t:CDS:2 [Ambispora gerdemannii]|uniref:4487_t:CDS:1 n=1 Tax=Ambispora gerdemannii TaxID=144530 RepID=A0A9N8WP28_9GLOM|nr:4487_t:CDS:2 [Ambispora gerdemannii]
MRGSPLFDHSEETVQASIGSLEECQEAIELKGAKTLREVIDLLQKTIHKFVLSAFIPKLLDEPHNMLITFPRDALTPDLELPRSVPMKDQDEIKGALNQINPTTGYAILLRYGNQIAECLNRLDRHLELRIEGIENENPGIKVIYDGELDSEKIKKIWEIFTLIETTV